MHEGDCVRLEVENEVAALLTICLIRDGGDDYPPLRLDEPLHALLDGDRHSKRKR